MKQSKLLYSYINDQKSCKDIIRALINENGEQTTEGEEIVNILNGQFCGVFNPSVNSSIPYIARVQ